TFSSPSDRLTQPRFEVRPMRAAEGQLGTVLQDQREVAMRERAKLANPRRVDGRGAVDPDEAPRIEALQHLRQARSVQVLSRTAVQIDVHTSRLNPVHVVD